MVFICFLFALRFRGLKTRGKTPESSLHVLLLAIGVGICWSFSAEWSLFCLPPSFSLERRAVSFLFFSDVLTFDKVVLYVAWYWPSACWNMESLLRCNCLPRMVSITHHSWLVPLLTETCILHKLILSFLSVVLLRWGACSTANLTHRWFSQARELCVVLCCVHICMCTCTPSKVVAVNKFETPIFRYYIHKTDNPLVTLFFCPSQCQHGRSNVCVWILCYLSFKWCSKVATVMTFRVCFYANILAKNCGAQFFHFSKN